MSEQVLYITEDPESFTEDDGRVFNPVPYREGWAVAVGWEDRLNSTKTEYSVIEYEQSGPLPEGIHRDPKGKDRAI